METPIKIDDMGVPPILGNPHIFPIIPMIFFSKSQIAPGASPFRAAGEAPHRRKKRRANDRDWWDRGPRPSKQKRRFFL